MSASREIAAGVCAGGMTITNGSSCWSESGVRTRMRTVSVSSANRSLQRRNRAMSRSVVVSALARVTGAESRHDAELTSVATAPWGDTQPAARNAAAASAVRHAARIGRIASASSRADTVRSIFARTEPGGRIAAPANFTAAISASERFRPSIGRGARPSAPGGVP